MNNNRSLRYRLLSWLIPSLLVLLIVDSLISYRVALGYATRSYDRALLDSARAIATQIRSTSDRTSLDLSPAALQILMTDKYDHIYFMVLGPHNEFIAGHQGLPPPPVQPQEKNRTYYDGHYRGETVRIAALYSPTINGDIKVIVAETLIKRHDLMDAILLGMLIPETLLVTAVISLIWFGVGHGLAPLNRLRQEIAARSSQDMRPVRESQAPEEVRPIVHELNALLGRLNETLTAQRRLISDAAHQIRTPIAALQVQLDAALRESDPDELRASLQRIHASAGRTAHLTHQLLTLARVEPGGQVPAEPQSLDLAELVRNAAADWMPQALAKTIDLGFELEPAPIFGEPLLLGEMLANLIDNALRYTQAGGRITVRTASLRDAALLEVEDDGPGIPPDERKQVLKRFHRIAGSPGAGCGLGLAIVEEISRSHNATVEIGAPPFGQGTLVRVLFPIRPSSLPEMPT